MDTLPGWAARARYRGDVDRFEMIPVALVASGFEAKLMAARLGSEGVVWELRGDVDGVYPVGGIEVLVPADEVEQAREVLGIDVDDHAG